MPTDNKARIRELNDALRTRAQGGEIIHSPGVNGLPYRTRLKAVLEIVTFNAFTTENDPHGEHDVGEVEADGVKVLWKIDTFYKRGKNGPDDPTDPDFTMRVMTIMLEDEW